MPITIEGVSVATMVGRVYDMRDSVAAFLIATGCAEPCPEPPSDVPLIVNLRARRVACGRFARYHEKPSRLTV